MDPRVVWAIYYQHFARENNARRRERFQRTALNRTLSTVFTHFISAYLDEELTMDHRVLENDHTLLFFLKGLGRHLPTALECCPIHDSFLDRMDVIQDFADALMPRAIASPPPYDAFFGSIWAGSDEKSKQFYRVGRGLFRKESCHEWRRDFRDRFRDMTKAELMGFEALDL
ncbi:hypothetical protein EBZ80_01345 [bacterium]|nr:hypothetical protein [bacterium]